MRIIGDECRSLEDELLYMPIKEGLELHKEALKSHNEIQGDLKKGRDLINKRVSISNTN